jgi:hypothetical protein
VAFSAAEHSAKWSASVDASFALKYNALFSLLAMPWGYLTELWGVPNVFASSTVLLQPSNREGRHQS